MISVSINTYKYEELSDSAKEKARDWYRTASADDNFWSESVLEDAESILNILGYESVKIFFRGFWSQGDGACFEATWRNGTGRAEKLKEYAPKDEELHRIADALQKESACFPYMYMKIKHSGHYYHEYCTSFDVRFTDSEDNDMDTSTRETGAQTAQCVEEQLIDLSRDLMCWVYKSLEQAWDWQNADEQVAESICANEYDFTVDGKRFRY
jgi:hypothetical protein